MKILGITNNDLSGAALVIDGQIIAAASEERFTRIKEHKGWPHQAIDFVMKAGGLKYEDLSTVAYGWSAGFREDKHLDLYLNRLVDAACADPASAQVIRDRIIRERVNDAPVRAEFDQFLARHGLADRAFYVDHHDCHAEGAFLLSPFDRALTVTADGRGDYRAFTIAEHGPDGCRVIAQETTTDSLGYFFGRLTRLLGYMPNRHEGKLTGLAAFGDPEPVMPLMQKMISANEGRIRAHCGPYYLPYYDNFSQELKDEIQRYGPADVAAAAQAHLENIVVSVVRHHMAKTPARNVCVAGGVFGNVKLNQRIAEIEGVQNLFVLPCMGDGGLALAAAAVAASRVYGQRTRLASMALGPAASGFSPPPNLRLVAESSDDGDTHRLRRSLIELLSAGAVVGVVRGRMEFGPRALCKRSIICSPVDPEINDTLNARLSRSEFMPFAPVLPEKLASICFHGWSY